jgi:hypothetical protein
VIRVKGSRVQAFKVPWFSAGSRFAGRELLNPGSVNREPLNVEP